MHIYSDKEKQIKTKENIYMPEEKLQPVVTQIALKNMKKLNIFTSDVFKLACNKNNTCILFCSR